MTIDILTPGLVYLWNDRMPAVIFSDKSIAIGAECEMIIPHIIHKFKLNHYYHKTIQVIVE